MTAYSSRFLQTRSMHNNKENTVMEYSMNWYIKPVNTNRCNNYNNKYTVND